MFSPDLLVLLSCAFAFGVFMTMLTSYAARRLGIVNHPNPLVPQHTRPVAYLGGLAIALAAALALLVCSGTLGESSLALPSAVFVGSGLFLALGIADDVRAFRPAPKFALQVAAAGTAVAFGLVYPFFGVRLLDVLLSGLWIVTCVNAVNFTDVCDGLVGGLAVVMLLFLGLRAGPAEAALSLALVGACGGFLLFNLPPARIFLGDAGTHFLGFLLAAYPLLRPGSAALWPFLAQTILIVGVPLFELVFLTVVRIRKGIPWWRGSPDHFSLRLQAAGLSRVQIDLLSWTAALLLGGLAHALDYLLLPAQLGVLLTVLVTAAVWGRLLLRWEVMR